MNTKERLQAARALVEKGWCQYSYAKNAENVQVKIESPEACQFCMRGALLKAVIGESGIIAELDNFQTVVSKVCAVLNTDVVSFNDTEGRIQEEVLEAFDEAIALC